METLTKDEFSELARYESDFSVSIYLPVHDSGMEVNEKQDQIVFKNLLAKAGEQLSGRGVSEQNVARYLKPAGDLINDNKFWLKLSKGLVLFISGEFFRIIHLPYSVKEGIYINSGFYLTPIVQLFCDCPYFYLLVLSKKNASFYRGNRYGMELLDIPGLPQGIDDVIHFEEKSERKLFRTAGTGVGGHASYHGHSSGLSDEKVYIAQYLTEVDQTLQKEVLANERAPLVLAGVEYILGLFRQSAHYKYIIGESLTGNYEHVDVKTVFQKGHDLARTYLLENSRNALRNYYNQLATPLTSSMPEKVIPASYYKQISELFVDQNAQIWGSFDHANNLLRINTERQPGDECLVNKAILNTLKYQGQVFLLEPERMPNSATIAATFRF